MNKHSMLIRLISLVLAIVLVTPVNAFAESLSEVQPRGSYYLSTYQAYVCPMGGGKINVYFEVCGTDYMDDVGVLSIEVYESVNNTDWYWVRTYQHFSYPGMLADNDFMHAGYVTYYGIAGRYYKAYVCVWAGKDGGGDTRYFWTSAKKAS